MLCMYPKHCNHVEIIMHFEALYFVKILYHFHVFFCTINYHNCHSEYLMVHYMLNAEILYSIDRAAYYLVCTCLLYMIIGTCN